MPTRTIPLLFGLFTLAFTPAVEAQAAGTLPTRPPPFESWNPDGSSGPAARSSLIVPPASSERRHRGRNALLGAAIGTVAGIGACTAISNIVADEGAGFSTCTTKGYLLFGGIGFAVGLSVGWLW